VIGGFFGETRIQIDFAGETAGGQRGRGQDMVDPPSEAPLHGARHPVIEEGVTARFLRMMTAEKILQPPSPDGGVGVPDLRRKTDMAEQPFRIVDVNLGRGDVQIAAPDQRRIG